MQFMKASDAAEAVRHLKDAGGKGYVLAGGTDLLPNLKHGLFSPKHLVSLSKVQGFDGISEEADGTLYIYTPPDWQD